LTAYKSTKPRRTGDKFSMGVIYKTIYSFEVLGKIKEGKEVFVLNRDLRKVFCLNDISTAATVKTINSENANNQYEFWIEEREETTE
jgi:hypothetical protein